MHHFETTSRPPASAATSNRSSAARPAYHLFERSFPASTSADLNFGTAGQAAQRGTDGLSSPGSGPQVVDAPSTAAATATPAVPMITARGIDIAGWTITATKGPIANSAQMDTFSSELGIPPPEMLFPGNSLVIAHHQPDGQRPSFTYAFDALSALASVHGVQGAHARAGLDLREAYERSAGASGSSTKLGTKPKSKGIKVAYAQEWGKSRTEVLPSHAGSGSGDAPSDASGAQAGSSTTNSFFGPGVAQAIASAAAAANATTDIASARDYDWTYSTTWPGTDGSSEPSPSSSTSSSREASDASSSTLTFRPGTDPYTDRIPIEKLGAGSEPILFYDEVVLFEDELADNGSSMLSVKVRVMPSGVLALQRFLLRVDGVLFRVFDTRLYAAFVPDGPGRVGHASALVGNDASGVGATTAYPGATRRQGPIPTLEPALARPANSTTTPPVANNPALQQGMARLSLGPTRRQMKVAAAAAAAAVATMPEGADTPMTVDAQVSISSATDGRAQDGQVRDAHDPSASEQPVLRVVRECAGWEATYHEVKAKLPPYKARDLSPLTDPNWISATLQSLGEGGAGRLGGGVKGRSTTPAPASYSSSSYSTASTGGGGPSARILGAVDEDKWEGVGARVDVVLIPSSPSPSQ